MENRKPRLLVIGQFKPAFAEGLKKLGYDVAQPDGADTPGQVATIARDDNRIVISDGAPLGFQTYLEGNRMGGISVLDLEEYDEDELVEACEIQLQPGSSKLFQYGNRIRVQRGLKRLHELP